MIPDKEVCPERLAWLRDIGGPALVSRLIDLFLKQAPLSIQTSQQAVQEGNLKTVEHSAHSIKSSAGNLGLVRLQELSAMIERLAGEGKAASVPPLLEEFEQRFNSIQAYLMATEREGLK